MPKFRFSAASSDGSVITGVQAGDALSSIRAALLERGLEPITIARKKSVLEFEITRKTVDKRQLMHLCMQLAVFLRSGISILEALAVLGEESTDKLMKAALFDIREQLEAGTRFTDAAAAHPELFPAYATEVLRSAELTGNLDEVLEQLGAYLEREIETASKVKSALAYPVIVLGLAVVVSVVLVTYVLPKFRTFFASLHAHLPLPTRMLLGIADFFGRFGAVLGAAIVVAVVLVVVLLRTQRGKEIRDHLILKAPVIGDLIKTAILERFCRLLASMTVAGVSLPEAIAVTTGATNNAVFRAGLSTARAAMMRGEGLAAPLSATGLFPGAARQMFRVGEDTGTLDEQLLSAANYLDRELEYKLKRFTTLIEPAVILAVGLIVGFVAVALVSAMYGIFGQVKAS